VRLLIAVCVLASVAVGCTRGTPSVAPSTGNATALPAPIIHVLGRSFVWQCQPVAEALVDVAVSRAGSRYWVRAIAGLWDHQAVAVAANDKNGCGRWTLALAPGLSAATRAEILSEVRQGVATFGVTASPVPKDPNNGMNH
jgi:hypothetical protein